jgi:DNA-binding response OmpR family regulator
MTDRAKILIVEDEMPVAMMMAYLLNRVGCEVKTACSAKKGLQLAQSGNFDLITLDVDLPGINGFEICRRLNENSRLCQTPIIFISGRPCEEDVQHGLRLGAADYIIKPFEVTDFIFRIISHAKPKADFDTVPVTEEAVA